MWKFTVYLLGKYTEITTFVEMSYRKDLENILKKRRTFVLTEKLRMEYDVHTTSLNKETEDLKEELIDNIIIIKENPKRPILEGITPDFYLVP